MSDILRLLDKHWDSDTLVFTTVMLLVVCGAITPIVIAVIKAVERMMVAFTEAFASAGFWKGKSDK